MLTRLEFSGAEGVQEKVETVTEFQSPTYYMKMHDPRRCQTVIQQPK